MTEEIPVILAYYAFSVQLLKRISHFPRQVRYGLGRSMEFRAEELLAGLIRAKYAPRGERDGLLREINVGLESSPKGGADAA